MVQECNRGDKTTQAGTRRDALRALAGVGIAGLSGCCSLRPFPTPQIPGEVPASTGTPFKPVVRKSKSAPALCIDAHTHFFNGNDVTVKGYLAGPVAHELKSPLKELVLALTPLADRLVEIAPTAAEEFKELSGVVAADGTLKGAGAMNLFSAARADAERQRVSTEFYRIVRGTAFEAQYNAIKRGQSAKAKSFMLEFERNDLSEQSLSNALVAGPGREKDGDEKFFAEQAAVLDAEDYPDGILAFMGYMLSSRWRNLQAYSSAYSSGEGAFGVDYAFGSLVDFDRWLDCPPRSSHEDQIKLHQLLSKLSDGYMKPLVSYNPWTDVQSNGASLALVEEAVTKRGFIGVKIYPPNGFLAYGNTGRSGSPAIGPSYAELDRVLRTFWEKCYEWNVPVMAHTNQSRGKDNDYDKLGGPTGWAALLKDTRGRFKPRVNLGHFGGDGDNDWTPQMAKLMTSADGQNVYGDIGFWSGLRCRDASSASCKEATSRLREALIFPGVGKRVMYGTDWLMLSKERQWSKYPFEIANATAGINGLAQADLFGENAKRCFPAFQSA